MRLEEQLRNFGRDIDVRQAPVSLDEIAHRTETNGSEHERRSSVRRRSGVWLATAACAIAVVAGFVVLVDTDDKVRTNDGTVPTVTLDDDTMVTPTATDTTVTPTTAAPSPVPPGHDSDAETSSGSTAGSISDIDAGSLRPLASFDDGDALVPTAPSDLRVVDYGSTTPDNAIGDQRVESYVDLVDPRRPEDRYYRITIGGGTPTLCASPSVCGRNTVAIGGVEWQNHNGFALVGRLGDRRLTLDNLQKTNAPDPEWIDSPDVAALIEGLRAGPPAVLEEVGRGCDSCELDGNGWIGTGADISVIGDVERGAVRPLSSLSPGDRIVPTAPQGWQMTADPSTGVSYAMPALASDLMLVTEIFPACDDTATSCESFGWPLSEEFETDGVVWGYPRGIANTRTGVGAVVGDQLVYVAAQQEWSRGSTLIPLLDHDGVRAFLEGLRATSSLD